MERGTGRSARQLLSLSQYYVSSLAAGSGVGVKPESGE